MAGTGQTFSLDLTAVTDICCEPIEEALINGDLVFQTTGFKSNGDPVLRPMTKAEMDGIQNMNPWNGNRQFNSLTFEQVHPNDRAALASLKQAKDKRAAAKMREQNVIRELVEKNNFLFCRLAGVTSDGWDDIINGSIRPRLGHGPLAEDDLVVATKIGMEASNGTPLHQINCPLSMSTGLRQVIKIIRGAFQHGQALLKKEEKERAKREEKLRKIKQKEQMKLRKKKNNAEDRIYKSAKRFLAMAGVEECEKVLGREATANAVIKAVRDWERGASVDGPADGEVVEINEDDENLGPRYPTLYGA